MYYEDEIKLENNGNNIKETILVGESRRKGSIEMKI